MRFIDGQVRPRQYPKLPCLCRAGSIISVGGGGDDTVEWEGRREAAVSLVHFANGDLVLISERLGSCAQVQVLSKSVLNVCASILLTTTVQISSVNRICIPEFIF